MTLGLIVTLTGQERVEFFGGPAPEQKVDVPGGEFQQAVDLRHAANNQGVEWLREVKAQRRVKKVHVALTG
jgi:hypothetical protein